MLPHSFCKGKLLSGLQRSGNLSYRCLARWRRVWAPSHLSPERGAVWLPPGTWVGSRINKGFFHWPSVDGPTKDIYGGGNEGNIFDIIIGKEIGFDVRRKLPPAPSKVQGMLCQSTPKKESIKLQPNRNISLVWYLHRLYKKKVYFDHLIATNSFLLICFSGNPWLRSSPTR